MTQPRKTSLLQQSRTSLGRLRRNLQAALLVQRGRQLATSGNQEAALAVFRRAFDLNPSVPLAVYESLRADPQVAMVSMHEAALLQQAGREVEADSKYALAIAHAGAYRESNDLDQLLQQFTPGEPVIITQLAINYFPMFEIWYRHFRHSGGRNLLAIALDPLVYQKLRDMDIPVYLLPVFNFQADVRSILWYETVKFRQRLNQRGVDYLHSDIDAFWLGNPVPHIVCHQADIVASIGYGTPAEVVDDWGFVMCLGFYLMRSTASTRRLYSQYVRYTKACGHDQNGLNTLLWQRGTTWRKDDEGILHGRCEPLDLTLVVVPDALISRREDAHLSGFRPLVIHPHVGMKSMQGKLQKLAGMGIE